MRGRYDFHAQQAVGQRGEDQLDALFSDIFDVIPATPAQQRQGIDRIFIERRSGRRTPVEYKTDWTASRTGNVFIETVSVDSTNIPGWAYTSRAEQLIYYLPADRRIMMMALAELRVRLAGWVARYPQRTVANHGYRTHGVLVPIEVFAALCLVLTVSSASLILPGREDAWPACD